MGGAETTAVELKVVIEGKMTMEWNGQGGQVQCHAEPYRFIKDARLNSECKGSH